MADEKLNTGPAENISPEAAAQLYKQAGNGVTVTVVEAIGKRLAATHREVSAID